MTGEIVLAPGGRRPETLLHTLQSPGCPTSESHPAPETHSTEHNHHVLGRIFLGTTFPALPPQPEALSLVTTETQGLLSSADWHYVNSISQHQGVSHICSGFPDLAGFCLTLQGTWHFSGTEPALREPQGPVLAVEATPTSQPGPGGPSTGTSSWPGTTACCLGTWDWP